MLFRETGEPADFLVRQHVARGIRRTRDRDGGDVFPRQRLFDLGKIDAILEDAPGFTLRPGQCADRQATNKSGSRPWSA